jgi:hypothetical protein
MSGTEFASEKYRLSRDIYASNLVVFGLGKILEMRTLLDL